MPVHGVLDFVQQVVHLVGGGAHLDGRVQQSGGPNYLLHHDTARLVQLELGRRGAHIDGLPDEALEFVELQGPVV